MGRARTIARRSFLIGSAAILGGVAFGAYFVTRPTPNPLLDGLAEGEAALTPFVKITPDGITLIVPRADVGQGIASTQAMLIADELDIDPATATLDPGQPHQAYFNATIAAESLPFPGWDHGFVASTVRDLMGHVARLTSSQFTGGSSSTADLHETLRLAGATARETLKAAAAARTGVPVADLRTENGHVVLPDGTRIPYTDLAAEAAAIEPITEVTLRPASQWTRLGKPHQRLDIVAKSTGTQDYGIDVVLLGMLHATVRTNPGRGGDIASYSADAALAMQGVRSVVEVNEGLAVIADNTWFAFKAAEALEVDWLAPDYPASSDEMWQALTDARSEEYRNSRLRDDGDVEAALNGATVIEAEYRSPFLAHAALEPLCATVLVEADGVQIWTATQVPAVVRDAAVEITGLDPAQVTLHVLPAGGSFGRRLDHDYVVQAIQIAATMRGTPIKTTWSREEDMTHDYPRPLHMAVGRGTVANGRVLAYDLDTISPSLVSSWFGRIFIVPPGPDTMLVWGAFDQPYAIPNYRVTGYAAPPMMPIGSWRSPGACSNSFFHESFLSELIHAAGADPLEERLRLIADADSRRVLEAVGEMSNWAGADIGPGRGRGIAFAHTHGVPVAEVIDVTMTERGIRIDEVWIAADCGTVLDPVNAKVQLTGAAIFGLGHAMNCELTYENHAVQQTNFHAFEGMRLHQTPLFHTQLLGLAERVRGLGEPATAPAAPALADAIFAATGRRPREMPFSKSVDFV
ncbi:xanthine dehydrogenase family protein molybdopterin-binding subunit [Roseisalinus antarcticus]|uniref:Isoquinoline 1-oxidoreductase subunit beta n=1 Tax=Roseisalinus antarcticus TaxID=254357 RepID=A0A1Y5U3B0_9RHOB|nr:molybdopterin cofactor-binding domain-containing protein [Roseisalinus antarcticus]SLN76153.1 Isoquinoline 1-oxidoreductase subunit beta [Roseisalinus antarcticus]